MSRLIYLFPLAIDIVLSLTVFVGRHSFAEAGFAEDYIAAISLVYGLVYINSCLVLGRVITRRLARRQMLAGMALLAALLVALANIRDYYLFLAVFAGVPVGTSLFFNAFQAYMVQADRQARGSVAMLAGRFTFAWSVGFALGPVLSAAMKGLVSWSAAYYLAALITVAVGALALALRPPPEGEASAPPPAPAVPGDGRRALPDVGWLGIALAIVGWLSVATCWPVQATILGFGAGSRALVEFSVTISQAFAALGVVLLARRGVFHRPGWLFLPAGLGIAGLLLIAGAGSVPAFAAGGICYGAFLGSSFVYMVYHALFEAERAIKRIAINEFMVGLSSIIGAVFATLLVRLLPDHAGVYRVFALLIGAGALAQFTLARARRLIYT